MDELSRWLRRQSERDARMPSLEGALLSKRFGRYAAYRLRYFIVRFCATAALHAAIVLLLYRTFGHRGFSSILAVYAAVNVLESFWWGALEAMRTRIRLLHRSGKPHLIPSEIGRWLSLSIQLALVLALGTAVWFGWQLATGRLRPAQAYIVVILFGLALGLVTSCYHSGVYALRRIYRPIGALVAMELVSLAGILGLRPWLGPWGFPAAALLSILTVTALAIYYSWQSYFLLRLAPETRLSVRNVRPPPRGTAGELLGGGLSYALMSLDALLVLVLFGTRPGHAQTPLFLLFFIVSPAVRAGFDWARLLYFDLKRLELRLFRNLRSRFRRAALGLAVILGVAFWAAACVTGTAVLGRSLGALYWILLVFFVVRSLLAVVQMDAFADRAYGVLLTNGLLCLVGFLVIGLGVADQRKALLGISAVALLAFMLLLLRGSRLRPLSHNREALWLSEWLHQLQAVREPVNVCAARVWSEPLERWPGSVREWEQRQRWRRRQLGDDIARRLKGRGAVSVLRSGKLLWFERCDGATRVSHPWLVKRTGGFVERIRDTGVAADGRTALTAACSDGLLGPAYLEAVRMRPERVVDVAAIKRTFARLVPKGAVFAPDEPIPQWLADLPAKELKTILADAAAFSREFTWTARRSPFDITALCLDAELRLIFVEQRDSENGSEREWRDLIQQCNVDAAVGAALAGEVPLPRGRSVFRRARRLRPVQRLGHQSISSPPYDPVGPA